MIRKLSFWVIFPVVLLWLCLPTGNRETVNEYEVRDALVTKLQVFCDSATIQLSADTVQAGKKVWVSTHYMSGSDECYAFHDSVVAAQDSIFLLQVRHRVYINRLCVAVTIERNKFIYIADSLGTGVYTIKANLGLPDSLEHVFVVVP